MSLRVTVAGKDKYFRYGSVAKASLNRALESVVVDAKPCDLPMGRMIYGGGLVWGTLDINSKGEEVFTPKVMIS